MVQDAGAAGDAGEAGTARVAPSDRGRHARRAWLYVRAIIAVVLVVAIVMLALDNTQEARLGWVFGSASASVVWIVIAAGVIGWLLGIVTGFSFRRRTRRSTKPA